MIKLTSLLLIFWAQVAMAELDLRGHNRLIGTTFMGLATDEDWQSSSQQIVLNHRTTALYTSDEHSFELAYELFGISDHYQNSLIPRKADAKFSYRVDDLNYYLSEQKQSDDHYYRILQNLDRFFYTYSSEFFEVNLGRQPISFGSARFINPLDVLVPFGFTMINMEQRLGVDGLRVKYAFSDMGLIDIGMVQDADLDEEEQYRFLSVRDKLGKADLLLLYQRLKKHEVWGLDLQADIWSWGVWLDYAFINANEADDFTRASLGGQYHFQNDVTVFWEYHYNEENHLSEDLGIFVTGERYLNFGGSYVLTPLKSVAMSVMNNLEDQSSLISPSFQYNYAENWYFDAGLYYGMGDNNSEFALYPQIVFISLKNFF